MNEEISIFLPLLFVILIGDIPMNKFGFPSYTDSAGFSQKVLKALKIPSKLKQKILSPCLPSLYCLTQVFQQSVFSKHANRGE
jgi:hypothetical protein